MKQKILQIFLTGWLGGVAHISNAQITYVFDTIQTDQYSALAHSYRLRRVSDSSLQREFEDGVNQFWSAYLSGMHKVMEENDDTRAAAILKDMKAELRPQYEHVMSIAKTWKKMHTSAELKKMRAWCAGNPYKSEARQLEADYNLQVRSEKSKSFHRAYLDLKKSIAKTD